MIKSLAVDQHRVGLLRTLVNVAANTDRQQYLSAIAMYYYCYQRVYTYNKGIRVGGSKGLLVFTFVVEHCESVCKAIIYICLKILHNNYCALCKA